MSVDFDAGRDGPASTTVTVTAAPLADGAQAVATAVRSDGESLRVIGEERLRDRAGTLARLGFAADVDDLVVIPDPAYGIEMWFAFGVGEQPTPTGFRRAGQLIGRGDAQADTIALDVRELPSKAQEACAAAFVEGLDLGNYRTPATPP